LTGEKRVEDVPIPGQTTGEQNIKTRQGTEDRNDGDWNPVLLKEALHRDPWLVWAVDDLPIGIFVSRILPKNFFKIRTCFVHFAHHHLGHREVVARTDVIGIGFDY
jgi:hypothetical protein